MHTAVARREAVRMPSPFPVWTPFIERQVWPGFRAGIVSKIRAELVILVGPRYFARSELQVYVEKAVERDHDRPELTVTPGPAKQLAAARAGSAVGPAVDPASDLYMCTDDHVPRYPLNCLSPRSQQLQAACAAAAHARRRVLRRTYAQCPPYPEIILKAGFDLCAGREELCIAGQTVFNIEGGALMVCLAPEVTRETLRGVAARTPQRFICLDSAFHGADALLTSAVLEMRDAGIQFQTM